MLRPAAHLPDPLVGRLPHGRKVFNERALEAQPSALGWDHINLTGDYTWKPHRSIEKGQFRPLRPTAES